MTNPETPTFIHEIENGFQAGKAAAIRRGINEFSQWTRRLNPVLDGHERTVFSAIAQRKVAEVVGREFDQDRACNPGLQILKAIESVRPNVPEPVRPQLVGAQMEFLLNLLRVGKTDQISAFTGLDLSAVSPDDQLSFINRFLIETGHLSEGMDIRDFSVRHGRYLRAEIQSALNGSEPFIMEASHGSRLILPNSSVVPGVAADFLVRPRTVQAIRPVLFRFNEQAMVAAQKGLPIL